jgi:hypothetical protein
MVAGGALGTALAEAERAAEVTYLTGSSVYVGSGHRDGLMPGTRLRGLDRPAGVVLEVVESTAHRAVCRVVEGSYDSLREGQRLHYVGMAQITPTASDPGGVGLPGLWHRAGVRGRIGVRYLATRSGPDDGAELRQPGIDLRLDGPALFGSPWNLYADVRARRTTRTLSDGSGDSEGRSRLYRLVLGWDKPGAGWRFALGRQFSPDLANVSVFDGLSAGYDRERWSAGLFAGTQPDARNYGYASNVREYGTFFALHAEPEAPRRWSITSGAVASYEDSVINREYVFLHARYAASRVTGFMTQEVDVNRGWKEDTGESTWSPTSTFLSVRLRVSDIINLLAGYDNRRDVRIFRDRTTPEDEFNDSFRRGLWTGAQISVSRHLRLGLAARTHRGGDAGDADSYTATLDLISLSSRNALVGLRSTRYQNERLEGWLHSVHASLDLGQRLRLGVQGGVRDDTSLLTSTLDDTVTWYGIDVDVDLLKSLYLTLSAERSTGDLEEVDQLYATLAYRY